ncbi:MAG: carboxypeptidase regulatory-like domain-containing protein, partial [Candidatus Hydrogenedentes bacterium]|nr:carboxypeptidase regulatory-like domain-containing protein [Candidatus Hydrogenedentota bacterium]
GVTVEGIVVDSAGKPVAGARVSCSGQEPPWSSSAYSGEDGQFVVEGALPTVDMHLWASYGTFRDSPRLGIAVGENGLDGLRVVLEPGQSGGIAGRFNLDLLQAKEAVRIKAMRVGASLPQPAHTSEVNEAGEFHITDLPPGEYELRIKTYSESHIDCAVGTYTVHPGETVEVGEIACERDTSATLRGKVVNEQGQPLPRAYVYIPAIMGARARTDAQGMFTLSCPGDRASRVMAGHADYGTVEAGVMQTEESARMPRARSEMDMVEERPVNVIQASESLTIVLPPRGQVSGRVIDAVTSKPITTYSIIQALEFGDTWDAAVKVSDAQGKFHLDRVDPVRAHLEVTAPGYVRGEHSLEVQPGEHVTGVEIPLTPRAILSGRVMDRQGKPVVHAQLYPNYPKYRNADTPLGTDEAGRFLIEHFPPSTAVVYAWAPGYGVGFSPAVFNADMTITLGPPTAVEGRITAGGEEVEQLVVNLQNEEQGFYERWEFEGPDFSIPMLPAFPLEARFEATDPDMNPRKAVISIELVEGQTTRLDFDFPPVDAVLRVTVLTASEMDSHTIDITVTTDYGETQGFGSSGRGPTTITHSFLPGEAELRATAGNKEQTFNIVLSPASEQAVEVDLR